MCPPQQPDNDSEPGLPPGAERFWGQMSQARTGRTGAEEAEPEASGEGESADAGGPVPAGGHECLEWCPICRSHELLKGVTSPEIRQQLQTIQQEAFQVFRAFAAAYGERTPEGQKSEGGSGKTSRGSAGSDDPVVTDITID